MGQLYSQKASYLVSSQIGSVEGGLEDAGELESYEEGESVLKMVCCSF